MTTVPIERNDIENPPALRATITDLPEKPRNGVDEVFDKHRELLFALMDKTTRPTAGFQDTTTFMTVINVLDVYAREIPDADKIAWQPMVGTTHTVIYGIVEETKP